MYAVCVFAVKSAEGKKAKAYAVLLCNDGANLTAGLYSDQGGHSWTCGQQNFNATNALNSVPIDGTPNTYPVVKSLSCQGCDKLKKPEGKGKKLTKCKGKAIKGPINDR